MSLVRGCEPPLPGSPITEIFFLFFFPIYSVVKYLIYIIVTDSYFMAVSPRHCQLLAVS